MNWWRKRSLIQRIVMGMVVGALLGVLAPNWQAIGMLGNLFVGALKALAPILVFFIVMSALAQHSKGQETNMKLIVILYLVGTLAAAFVGVVASFLFPLTLTFGQAAQTEIAPPQGIAEVVNTLLLNLVDNPVNALAQGNFIGILFWSSIFGIAFRMANPQVKALLETCSEVTSQAVRWVIACAPFGILGLVFQTVSKNGLEIFTTYGSLLAVLVGSMIFVALVVNPIIVTVMTRENPYPLVFKCLRDSAITAFFTRSSAANIPVNMQLCEELGLDEDNYSVSIPLGATINMAGAAITISVLTLAACHTLGIQVDFVTALILSVLSAVSACGASGVAGGSLLLIPVACSLFGIPADIAMQVVGVGFIIGVIQDSCETAVNSSTDVLFTAAAEFHHWKKAGRPIWPHPEAQRLPKIEKE